MQPVVNIESERKEILARYKNLLRTCRLDTSDKDKQMIRKAFDLAVEAHKDMRRKTGEPYIYHPLAVAQVCTQEIGLGTTSIICSLLHDVVEDTDYTLEDIKALFGEKVTRIIDGLTKISGIFDYSTASIQAENFKKMLLTLSDDVRVILIKLADRLHNMRTLDAMVHDKQLKISSETLFLYAPLAHRLGLYAIKSELEDLSLKYTEPEIYNTIIQKLKDTEKEREKFLNTFKLPIVKTLNKAGIKHRITGRAKSIYSIWNKMKTKSIPFEEVFDLLAIRIVIDTPIESEKTDCWKVYSAVTDSYRPYPDRLRDWISTPKANGYEALHTTVMSQSGQWVEVQIRSERMDDIAERGYAAHWKYKENDAESAENALDKWLKRIRELLQSPESNALDFLDEFKLNLFSDEIFAFTPKGEMRTLPKGSTVLDFAYSVHSQVGNTCIGAKVNHLLVPLSYQLRSGDQIEIITSARQKPNSEWLSYVLTARAKSNIEEELKKERKKIIEEGKEDLKQKFIKYKIEYDDSNIEKLREYLDIGSENDLFYNIALNKVKEKDFKAFINDRKKWRRYLTLVKAKDIKPMSFIDGVVDYIKSKPEKLAIKGRENKSNYSFSHCCNPIPGDEIVGFEGTDGKINLHRVNCDEAIKLMSKHGDKIIKARLTNDELISFLVGIKFTGIDKVGIVNNITRIVSEDENINIKSICFEGNDGIFEGVIMLYVLNREQMDNLVSRFKRINGIENVKRI